MSDEEPDQAAPWAPGYIPFDFGSWKQHAGMSCARHGKQDGGLAISVRSHRADEPYIRRYCGLCVLDALDRFCEGQADG